MTIGVKEKLYLGFRIDTLDPGAFTGGELDLRSGRRVRRAKGRRNALESFPRHLNLYIRQKIIAEPACTSTTFSSGGDPRGRKKKRAGKKSLGGRRTVNETY